MKTEISQNEYLQLVGLMTLAKIHGRNVDACRNGMQEVLGIGAKDDEAGHVDDEVWGTSDGNVDALLKRLKIAVLPAPAEPESPPRYDISEEERQTILCAIAKLSLLRPGWEFHARNIAEKLNGVEMFDEFRKHGALELPHMETGNA